MDYKKIKKSESSLGGIVFSLIIAMLVFSFGFYWIQQNAEESGRTVDTMYNESFTNLAATQTDLNNKIEEIFI
jgi:hypothetical protein